MSDFRERRVTSTDGVEIAYLSFGEGLPLIISHGGFTVAEEWFETARALSGDRQIVVIERRGRGRSGDAAIHSLDQEIDDLAAIVTDLGGEVELFGHSYGGALSLGYALQTGFAGNLILYEPTTAVAAPVGGENMRPVWELHDRGELDQALSLLYTSVLRMPPAVVESFRTSDTWTHHRSLLTSFLREVDALDGFAPTIEECSKIRSRTLLLLGSEADQWTRNNAGGFVQRLPGLTLLPVFGESHFAHLNAPGMLARRVREGLKLLERTD